jgi:hypothetical protein
MDCFEEGIVHLYDPSQYASVEQIVEDIVKEGLYSSEGGFILRPIDPQAHVEFDHNVLSSATVDVTGYVFQLKHADYGILKGKKKHRSSCADVIRS